MQSIEPASQEKRIVGARRLHLQALKRCLVPKRAALRRSNLPDRVLTWLFPWTVETYPGQHRGMLAVLGNRVGWDTVRHWLHDRRPIPGWARAVLADYIEARCRAGLDLAAELRAEPERKAGNRARPNDPPPMAQGG
jgi:hypothetical protein